jgi:predicted DNA-binding transcriptional regulator AlpA
MTEFKEKKFYKPILRIDDIVELLNISRATFWRLRKDEGFPNGKKISKRIEIWNTSQIQDWIEAK